MVVITLLNKYIMLCVNIITIEALTNATDHVLLVGVSKNKLSNSQCGLVTIRSHTTQSIMSEAYIIQITNHL